MDYKDTYSRRKKSNFKTLGMSRIVCLPLIITLPNSILEEIQKIQKKFYGTLPSPKSIIKTLCNTFEDGGLKNVEVKSKIISFQCSWVKLYDGNHHDWKVILLYFINKYFGKNFHFHLNLSFNLALVDNFQEFLSKPLLIGAVALFPILKFYLAFNPIFYGTINIY